jgi:hypothetical protein
MRKPEFCWIRTSAADGHQERINTVFLGSKTKLRHDVRQNKARLSAGIRCPPEGIFRR